MSASGSCACGGMGLNSRSTAPANINTNAPAAGAEVVVGAKEPLDRPPVRQRLRGHPSRNPLFLPGLRRSPRHYF